ncbi:MAG: hypothetical protein J7K04_07655 [Spirochaetales bacterium]|nr:hypothetical protein [Spirochaetales bacterium]
MEELIGKAGEFTAFLALNGRLLKTGISIFLSRGIKIGKELELASHGDVSYIFPPYSNSIIHVVQPAYEMGWEAAKMLLSNIKHPDRAVIHMILKSSVIDIS